MSGKSHMLSALMTKYWKYEWIKELSDDEEAKPVIGNDGYYITNKGRVFSEFYNRWLGINKLHHPNIDYYTHTCINSKRHLTHILVAEHFMEGYDSKLLVLHKDETLPVPIVNQLPNLWQGTQKDNIMDAAAKGRLYRQNL